MASTLQEWLRQGEVLHGTLVKEYQDLEQQRRDLEEKLNAKRTEMNQVARMMGLPATDGDRRPAAPAESAAATEDPAAAPDRAATAAATPSGGSAPAGGLVVGPAGPAGGNSMGNGSTNANIARALAGKFATGGASASPMATSPVIPRILEAPTRRA